MLWSNRDYRSILPTSTWYSELYGFTKTNGSGSQKEDLVLTKTQAGTDDISVANNDGTQSDLYDESFINAVWINIYCQ